MRPETRREILAFFVLFLSAFLLVSFWTRDPEDALLHGLWSREAKSAGGPLGALVSRELEAWLGVTASYALIVAIAAGGVTLLFRKRIEELPWKLIGGALLLVSIATLEVAASGSASRLDSLPGGYYGQFIYGFLFSHLDRFGAYLLVSYALLVAIIITTDTLVLPALARAGSLALVSQRFAGRAATRSSKFLSAHAPRAAALVRAGLGRALAPLGRRLAGPAPVPATTGGAVTAPAARPSRPRRTEGGAASSASSPTPASATGASRTAPQAPPQTQPPATPSAAGTAPGNTESRPAATSQALPAQPLPAAAAPPAAAADPDAVGDDDERKGGAKDEEETEIPAEAARPRPPIRINIAEPPPRTVPAARQAERRLGNYKLPPFELLDAPEPTEKNYDRAALESTAKKIEDTLRNFKIEAQVVEIQKGPVITLYEVSLSAGIKVHKIMALADDLAMALKAPSIRIVAPIPGKSTVGVEVPNQKRSMVGLRELCELEAFRNGDFKIPLLLGKDTAGKPIIGDLGEMPHLLIAGSTGSGKSVCINAILTNILLTKTPEEVKLILVDPKMVELSFFEELPHLLTPVVTDMKKAPAVLEWLVEKMEERYELLALAGVRNITSFNALGKEKLVEVLRQRGEVEEDSLGEFPDFLPHYVMVMDELADLMMTAPKEVEASITRLSQKSRAVGIHIILATQRPSVDVITGLIKANMPSRISFHVASKVDSRTILDRNGADKLLGKGDLLYLAPGTSNLVRAQGTYISDREIREVVRFVRNEAEPQFHPELSRLGSASMTEGTEEDDLYEQAVRIILESQRGSVTLLQRQLQIGYTRASRLMEIMHENGLVGPFKGSKAREVYYQLEDWEAAMKKAGRGGGGEDGGAEEAGAEAEGD